jgi:HEAT repeats
MRPALRRCLPVAILAVAALGAGARDPQIDRAVAALREDGSVKVRAQAAFVLAQRGAAEAVPALSAALAGDEAAAVRIAAATALGRIGALSAVGALRKASSGDADRAVRDAAARALDELVRGARSVSIEPVQGPQGDARAWAALRDALGANMARHGFAVAAAGEAAGWRLKPSVLVVDVARAGGGQRVEVKASVIAVDAQGRIAAMVEGGARARTAGAAPGAPQLTEQALEAAARSISEDLAARLQVPR